MTEVNSYTTSQLVDFGQLVKDAHPYFRVVGLNPSQTVWYVFEMVN